MTPEGPEVHPEPGERVAPPLRAKAALPTRIYRREITIGYSESWLAWCALIEGTEYRYNTWERAVQAVRECLG